jgi:ACR3 family arsenite efflux pump ArsB
MKMGPVRFVFLFVLLVAPLSTVAVYWDSAGKIGWSDVALAFFVFVVFCLCLASASWILTERYYQAADKHYEVPNNE